MPRAIAARAGQKTVALNYEGVARHQYQGDQPPTGVNDVNQNMPPNTLYTMSSQFPKRIKPLGIVCSIHTWMSMYGLAVDHPYFAVTAADGSFELKYSGRLGRSDYSQSDDRRGDRRGQGRQGR